MQPHVKAAESEEPPGLSAPGAAQKHLRTFRCNFGVFFDGRTPDDLLQGGLYHDLALALYSGHFWPTSVALVAKALGASESRSGFRTTGAERSAPPGANAEGWRECVIVMCYSHVL